MLSFYLSMIDSLVDQLHFENLYNKYKIELMQYATTLTKNHHDAEEICQDAWLAVANQFDVLKTQVDEKIKAYIIKTVKYMFFDYWTKKEKTEQYMSHEIIESLDKIPDSLDSVLITICRRETEDAIYDCINSLDEIYRDVLDFYYINQSSPRDIAEFLCIDVKTARKRIERGRAMLIKMLIEKGEGNENKI